MISQSTEDIESLSITSVNSFGTPLKYSLYLFFGVDIQCTTKYCAV